MKYKINNVETGAGMILDVEVNEDKFTAILAVGVATVELVGAVSGANYSGKGAYDGVAVEFIAATDGDKIAGTVRAPWSINFDFAGVAI